METIDYAPLLPAAPEVDLAKWLRDQGELRQEHLIYRAEWVPDPLTGIRRRMARVTCSHCEDTFYADRSYGDDGAPFGWYNWEAGKTVNSEEPTRCPSCGHEATALHSLGEQLQAVVNSAKTHTADKRLLQVNNAVNGSNEGTGADGGFAVQEDFAGQILKTAVSTGDILSRVDSYTVGANSNAARWLMVDETDVSASVFGGVQMYWAAEGATVNASRPKFKELKLDLEKMMGFAYATDELLQDAAFMTGFFGTAFSVAANRLLEDSIISGDGNGKPTGILSSGALIEAPAEAGQAAETLNAQNILKMWGRALVSGRKDMVWLMHPDLEEQLPQLMLGDKPIWMPEGGISGAQYQTILGRPVLFNDNCKAIGTKGDVLLADMKQYMLLKKGTAKQDWSMHVEFLTDQMCFRLVFRCNGTPKVTAPVKLKNSERTRSPFVTLAARTGAGGAAG